MTAFKLDVISQHKTVIQEDLSRKWITRLIYFPVQNFMQQNINYQINTAFTRRVLIPVYTKLYLRYIFILSFFVTCEFVFKNIWSYLIQIPTKPNSIKIVHVYIPVHIAIQIFLLRVFMTT